MRCFLSWITHISKQFHCWWLFGCPGYTDLWLSLAVRTGDKNVRPSYNVFVNIRLPLTGTATLEYRFTVFFTRFLALWMQKSHNGPLLFVSLYKRINQCKSLPQRPRRPFWCRWQFILFASAILSIASNQLQVCVSLLLLSKVTS